jgi:molecular chaperone GrpE
MAQDDVDIELTDDADEARAAIDPAEFEAVKRRAEGAERKLQDVQAAFVAAKGDLDATRERLLRDAEKKVEIRFGDMLTDLLETVDDLDRAIEHGASAPAAAPVVQGVAIARERFVAALQKAGVSRLDPAGEPFDPNLSEAVGIVPVSDPAQSDHVMTVVRAGYALGGRIIRPARVLIGRLVS